jgi:polyisoprenoid-binding protein YceI
MQDRSVETMNLRAFALVTPLLWTVLPIDALAALQAAGGTAMFVAVGPAGLRIEGRTSEVTVSEAAGDVRVIVALANLDTGIGLRNRHMREKYLEVDKYPTASLVVGRAGLRFPDEGQEIAATAAGTMTIHGKAHPVTFSYTARHDHGAFRVSGSVHLDMRDYDIRVPSYLGITVKPEVDVTVQFDARDV